MSGLRYLAAVKQRAGRDWPISAAWQPHSGVLQRTFRVLEFSTRLENRVEKSAFPAFGLSPDD
jgi:hypothetical protein